MPVIFLYMFFFVFFLGVFIKTILGLKTKNDVFFFFLEIFDFPKVFELFLGPNECL